MLEDKNTKDWGCGDVALWIRVKKDKYLTHDWIKKLLDKKFKNYETFWYAGESNNKET